MFDKVNSKYVLKEIFGNIKNKRKLNIIKYNKRIQSKLGINKTDFKIYITLKEFNNKYNIDIDDIDITELNLSKENIGNKGLNDLAKIKFKGLNKLDLSYNQISYIYVLDQFNFKELKKLDLSKNIIREITILGIANLENLNILDLS